jgi:hypothetical protein
MKQRRMSTVHPSSFIFHPFIAAVWLALFVGLAVAEDAPPTTTPAATAKPAADAPRIEGGQVNGRWREGSKLNDQAGNFKLTGDRVTFVAVGGKLKFLCLENLCIERVSRVISDSPDQLEWSVSGVITEYRGANYLLATQAVLRTKSDRLRRSP